MSDKEKFEDIEEAGDREEVDDVKSPEDAKQDGYEDVCYICRRPESKAGKMIRIPNDICICSDCMQKTFDTMNHAGFPIGDMGNFGNMPNISMINLSDLQNMNIMPKSQKLKKKKPKEEKKAVEQKPRYIAIEG